MQVFEWLMCSDAALDSHRFKDSIDSAIEAKQAKSYKIYGSWAASVTTRKPPKDPFGKKAKKQKTSNDEQALVTAIRCLPFKVGSSLPGSSRSTNDCVDSTARQEAK